MKIHNFLCAVILCFICTSCANYAHIPKNINKTSDKGKEGLWIIENDTTGVIIIENYHLGKRNGKYYEYYKNGQIALIGNYKKEVPDRIWVRYYPNGKISSKVKYKKGRMVKGKSHFSPPKW
ncbi:MAG: hypothetical protein FWH36_08575 [Lentimicrobiaceae bacterium]|nr:hypothetical protein [Lentimicrobiaceae bacterium]